jgi:branched-chain amino acid transport system ATP-binding protein
VTIGSAAGASAPALQLQGVGRRFGALQALRDVTMEVTVGERRAILGPNGAGKTTLFNVVAGDFPPTSGTIRLYGTDVTHLQPHRRTRLGLTRTYQN